MSASTSIIDLIRKQLEFVGNENHWHASLIGLANAVTEKEAAWRPELGGHTIYEIIHHLAYSAELSAAGLQGAPQKWDEAESWLQTPEPLSQEAWEQAISRLLAAREHFLEAVCSLGEEKLTANREDKPPAIEFVLQIIHHEAFHAGQIALLRRQQGKQALI